MTRIAINGLGRVGRLALRRIVAHPALELVAVNDLMDGPTLAHLCAVDSVHGAPPFSVAFREGCLVVDGRAIPTFSPGSAAAIPFDPCGAEVVLDCTGATASKAGLLPLLAHGVKHVLSAADLADADATVALGLNDASLDATGLEVVALADPAAACLGYLCKVLDEAFGLEGGFATLVESYRSDQRILDLPHPDLRLARAATQSMIPAPSPAAETLARVLPGVEGRLRVGSVRVPTVDGTLVDFTARLRHTATLAALQAAFEAAAAAGPLSARLRMLPAPLVSSDLLGQPHTCQYDPFLSQVLGPSLVKVFGWCDAETAAAEGLVCLAARCLGVAP